MPREQRCKQCGWIGTSSQMVLVKDERELEKSGRIIAVHTCPNCGNDEFYLYVDTEKD